MRRMRVARSVARVQPAPVTPPARAARWFRRHYFSAAAAVVVGLSLIGFSDNLITDVGQPSNRDPKFVVHGLFCFAWVLLFLVQANLVRRGDLQAHRRLGVAMALVAAGVLLSTWYIQALGFEGWAQTPFLAKSNILFITSFGAVVVLGFLNRRERQLHKRLMLLATLYMLGPIVDRVGGAIGVSPFVTNPVLWNAMFLSFLAYDWFSGRRIHPVTSMGYAWFWAVWVLAIFT